jgi:acyl-CoA thioester hydrolase
MRWIEAKVTVRFNEVDPWQMVWYGNYLAFFDVARLQLLEQFGLLVSGSSLLDFKTPIVSLKCRFKTPARFNDHLVVRVTVLPSETASLTFLFEILRPPDQAPVASGETTHVLQDAEGRMIYKFPEALREKIEAMITFCNPPAG